MMRNSHVNDALKIIAEEKEEQTGTIFLNVMDLHHIPPEIEFLPHLNKVCLTYCLFEESAF
jgi:hypothetical protein